MKPLSDDELAARYRAASQESPSPALGEAIRRAAGSAVQGQQLRRRRRWGAGLALAASVVLGLGMVLRTALERPDLAPAGAPPPTVAAAGAPQESVPVASGATQAQAGDAAAKSAEKGSLQKADSAEVSKNASRPRAEIRPPVTVVPAKPAGESMAQARDAAVLPERAKAAATVEEAPPRAASAVASAPATPPATPLQEAGANMMARAPEAAPAGAAGAARARAAPGVAAERRDASVPGAVDARVAGMTPAEESALPVADWIRRIVDLRRAGRHADADESLRRFIARHPGERVPDEARAR